MGAFTYIETDTGTNVDISAATAVGAYTSTGDKLIMVDVSIDAVAGNGDYVMYVTRQIGGSGSAYRILPQTTMAAASGLTAISAQSGWITVRNGDVLTCYVDGLAGDTTTPDWTTRWFELAAVAAPDNTGIAAIQAKTDQLTFTTPNKVDATATVDTTGIATSAALAVVDANVDAIKAKTDLMDASSISVVSPISGTAITILRGDTFECSISDLGSLADYVSLDFTVKSDKSDADSAALIRIRLNATGLTDGLLTLNGATASNADDGSIAITDAAAGDITITLAASCTDDLATGTYAYDVQLIEAADVSTLTSGKATVTADVTRAVS
jgi:hypothetical protein